MSNSYLPVFWWKRILSDLIIMYIRFYGSSGLVLCWIWHCISGKDVQDNLEMIKEDISWEIGNKLIGMIAETTQAPGVLIVHKNDTYYEGTDNREGV